MGKKYRGQRCVYCAKAVSTTGDHVFAREFFLPEDRDYLPKVPACERCNNQKSQLEHYLTAILPFGGRHSQAGANLARAVPSRLRGNRKLHEQLAATTRQAWMQGRAGIFVPTATFPIDGARLVALVSHIVRGLVWHHWRTYLGPEDFVEVMFLTGAGAAAFDQTVFSLQPERRVISDLGHGTVLYEGRQAADPPPLTLWRVAMYGGLVLSGDEPSDKDTIPTSSQWAVMTGPPAASHVLEIVKRLRN